MNNVKKSRDKILKEGDCCEHCGSLVSFTSLPEKEQQRLINAIFN